MPTPILQVKGLTLISNRGPIVSDLSFSIASGEIVALTGKSGSGKTSIALALLHLLPKGIQHLSGTISWTGKDQNTLKLPEHSKDWPRLRGTHIGYTQQDVFGAFDPVLQMGSQMMMIVRDRVVNPNTSDLEKLLRIRMEEVGLHEIDRLWISYPHQLSGGQLQRCQISMAIVIQPEVLISDEPTSAIDKINQLELLDVFSMLREKYNMAILCITHEDAVVRYLADREIRLDEFTPDFSFPDPDSRNADPEGGTKVLEVTGLEYTHTFGGMMYKKGAMIGPLDFTIYRGSCMGIVGESGSGKSTLAQLLVGLFVPSKGKVFLEGREVDYYRSGDMKNLRNKVQLVMQDGRGSLHPDIIIRALLTEVSDLRLKTGLPVVTNLKEALHDVGLPESVLDRKSTQLSGGECLRVSIARALLMQPEVLICDESTSSLDGPTRDGIIALLLELMKVRHLALIIISHDEQIVRGVSHEIMVMSEGKVVEKGPAKEILHYPTHPATKKIFGTHATLAKRQRL